MSDTSILSLLIHWLDSRLSGAARDWLNERRARVAAGQVKDLYLAFGHISRNIPNQELALDAAEIASAEELRPGWHPQHWGLRDVARMSLVLAYKPESTAEFVKVLDRLFVAGEVHELIALYQGLPLYPEPAVHVARAGEGIRTNMGAVFKAVAHHNPYPAEQLPEGMWNQMILKCLFVEIPLHPVMGLEQRKNPALTKMLCDYAHERWAAHRPVAPELWRCVEPAWHPEALTDLEKILQQGSLAEQQAAALTLSTSQHPHAPTLLDQHPHWKQAITNGTASWDHLPKG